VLIAIERQMAEQTGASEPLGGATTAQGAHKVPSPAALAGRRKDGKNWTIDIKYAPMDAYAKSSFDFDFIHSTRYGPPVRIGARPAACPLRK
jgi:hypothetical protein